MKNRTTGKDTGVLTGLGVTPAEEHIYIGLLKRDGASAAELAASLRESSRSVDTVSFDASGLGDGTYRAYVCVRSCACGAMTCRIASSPCPSSSA
ncbi:MAG: hypothetical protein ABI843_12740 [Dokdonella sp.]